MGIMGGVFAIPLATLVNAVIKAWPAKNDLAEQENKSEEVAEAKTS